MEPTTPRISPLGWVVRVGLPAFVAIALGLTIRHFFGHRLDVASTVALLRTVEDSPWAYLIFVVAYIVGTAVAVPAMLFHVAAGLTFGFPVGLTLNLIGLNASASAHFVLSRKLGRHTVHKLLSRTRLQALERLATAAGYRTMVAIRLLPLPHVAVNLASGVSAVAWRDFALGTLIGTLPATCTYTFFAAALIRGGAGIERQALKHVVIGGIVVLLATFLPRLIARERKPR